MEVCRQCGGLGVKRVVGVDVADIKDQLINADSESDPERGFVICECTAAEFHDATLEMLAGKPEKLRALQQRIINRMEERL